jgi:hypothetical protein
MSEEQKMPSKEEVVKFLQEQIDVKKVQFELQDINTKLAVARAEELKALQFIAQLTNPQPPSDAVEHTLTEEDFEDSPELKEQGLNVGDKVLIPKEMAEEAAEKVKRSLKK